MEITEDFLGPKVDATFAWIAMGKFDNGYPLRPEKKNERDKPQPYCYTAIRRDRWHDV